MFECPNIMHTFNYFHKRYAIRFIFLAFIAPKHLYSFGTQVSIDHKHYFLVVQFDKKGYSLE